MFERQEKVELLALREKIKKERLLLSAERKALVTSVSVYEGRMVILFFSTFQKDIQLTKIFQRVVVM